MFDKHSTLREARVTFMFPVGMCSVVRAEYIPRGRRQRHSALGEVSNISMCYCCNLRKWHIFFQGKTTLLPINLHI